MIITYLRSSSYGTYSFCEFQFFLSYVLGIRDPGNRKAELGNMTHKMLELLARRKLARQAGQRSFCDEELGTEFEFETATFSPEDAAQAAVSHYVPKSIHAYSEEEIATAISWMWDALRLNHGQVNPLNRTVLWPEKYFDLPIEQEWAKYDFVTPWGERLVGTLAIKGTMDLVCRIEGFDDVLELVDWKTGSRIDWGTGEEKTIAKLRDDPQLRLYHYALSRLVPWARQIIVTIVWIRDGGVYTLPPFTKADLPKTEEMLRERFEEIRESTLPKQSISWRCGAFCYYGRNKLPGSQDTICAELHSELVELGLEKTMLKRGTPAAFSKYGSGGGVANRDGTPDGIPMETGNEVTSD